MLSATKIPYVTRQAHGSHPTGSKCLVYRESGKLYLEFEDGEVISYDGGQYYVEGVEERHRNLWDTLNERIKEEIDQEILGELLKLPTSKG